MCQEFCRGLYFTAKFLQTNLWVYTLMIKGSFDVLMIVVLCIVRLISRIMGKSDICYGGKAWAFQSNMGGVGAGGGRREAVQPRSPSRKLSDSFMFWFSFYSNFNGKLCKLQFAFSVVNCI